MEDEDYKKKYEKAIKRAEAVIKVAQNQKEVYGCITTIFPELKESKDEKIRKELIDYCHERLNTTYGALPNIETIKRWLTWLEKQGEQKSAWSEEDEIGLGNTMWAIEQARTIAKDVNDMGNLWNAGWWLKSIKERIKGE